MSESVNEIKATKKINGVDKEATILFDFGGSVEAAIEKFGSNVVYSNFVRSSVITAQAAMRRFLEDGLGQDEIEAKMADWKPGVSLERTYDPLAALLNKMATMTPEEREAAIEKLKAAM